MISPKNKSIVPVRIEVPVFVREYCQERFTETREHLDDRELDKAFKKYSLKAIPAYRIPQIKKNDPVLADIDSTSFFEGENVELFIMTGREHGLHKVLVKYPVLPLTVMRKPVLRRAAELEYSTYSTNYPMSLQEARWQLVDEYPETNKHFSSYIPWLNPESCINLIREVKGCFKLSLNETRELARERRRANAMRGLFA